MQQNTEKTDYTISHITTQKREKENTDHKGPLQIILNSIHYFVLHTSYIQESSPLYTILLS